MTTLEHELIDKIKHMDTAHQQRLLQFIQEMDIASEQKAYSVSELLKLPYEERNRLAAEALAHTADEDVEVFEAFGEADFDDDSL
jgi:hypothetical protein